MTTLFNYNLSRSFKVIKWLNNSMIAILVFKVPWTPCSFISLGIIGTIALLRKLSLKRLGQLGVYVVQKAQHFFSYRMREMSHPIFWWIQLFATFVLVFGNGFPGPQKVHLTPMELPSDSCFSAFHPLDRTILFHLWKQWHGDVISWGDATLTPRVAFGSDEWLMSLWFGNGWSKIDSEWPVQEGLEKSFLYILGGGGKPWDVVLALLVDHICMPLAFKLCLILTFCTVPVSVRQLWCCDFQLDVTNGPRRNHPKLHFLNNDELLLPRDVAAWFCGQTESAEVCVNDGRAGQGRAGQGKVVCTPLSLMIIFLTNFGGQSLHCAGHNTRQDLKCTLLSRGFCWHVNKHFRWTHLPENFVCFSSKKKCGHNHNVGTWSCNITSVFPSCKVTKCSVNKRWKLLDTTREKS